MAHRLTVRIAIVALAALIMAPLAAPPAPVCAQPAPATPLPAPPAATPAPPSIPPPPQAQPLPSAPAPSMPAAVNPERTLADKPGDPSDVDDIALTARPALVLGGRTTWERGLEDLTAAHDRLAAEARRLGLAIAGRPVTVYQETDDSGFRYEALQPVDRAPDAGATLQGDFKAGATPAGRALRFVHRGAYEDIDATYEGITAYLDAKGVTVKDQFAEEFVVTPRDPVDTDAEVNIYVLPR